MLIPWLYLPFALFMQDIRPHRFSGPLNSAPIDGEYRVYYHRLFARWIQNRGPFCWAVFIAKHSGTPLTDVESLKKFVIPYDQWAQHGVVFEVTDFRSVWGDMRGSNLDSEQGMRISVEGGEKKTFRMPPNPDEGVMNILAYVDEVIS
jgi:hypothetical protein